MARARRDPAIVGVMLFRAGIRDGLDLASAPGDLPVPHTTFRVGVAIGRRFSRH